MKKSKKPLAKRNPVEKRDLKSLAILILGTVFISIAQLLIKIGSGKIIFSALSMATNYALILGFTFYGLSAITFILALKKLELSVAYPVISLSFVWVTILSSIFLGEKIAFGSVVGILLVIFGVSVLGRGVAK